MQAQSNQQLFLQAQKHIPGGVNSPVRAFKGVGGDPIFSVAQKVPGSPMWKVKIILIISAHGDR